MKREKVTTTTTATLKREKVTTTTTATLKREKVTTTTTATLKHAKSNNNSNSSKKKQKQELPCKSTAEIHRTVTFHADRAIGILLKKIGCLMLIGVPCPSF